MPNMEMHIGVNTHLSMCCNTAIQIIYNSLSSNIATQIIYTNRKLINNATLRIHYKEADQILSLQ